MLHQAWIPTAWHPATLGGSSKSPRKFRQAKDIEELVLQDGQVKAALLASIKKSEFSDDLHALCVVDAELGAMSEQDSWMKSQRTYN